MLVKHVPDLECLLGDSQWWKRYYHAVGSFEGTIFKRGDGVLVETNAEGLVVPQPSEADVFCIRRGLDQTDDKAVGVRAGPTLYLGQVREVGGPPDNFVSLFC